MASVSTSGNSSSSSPIVQKDDVLKGDSQQTMDQRKRKRKESNRESARRSRMRKQKHLDDLLAQVDQIKKENGQILNSINVTTQHFVNVEAENSILRAQMLELSHRLNSLNEILSYINSSATVPSYSAVSLGCMFEADDFQHLGFSTDNLLNTPMTLNQHPIMASAEIFDY